MGHWTSHRDPFTQNPTPLRGKTRVTVHESLLSVVWVVQNTHNQRRLT